MLVAIERALSVLTVLFGSERANRESGLRKPL